MVTALRNLLIKLALPAAVLTAALLWAPLPRAKAAIGQWIDADGRAVDVAGTSWSSRLEFLSPVHIRDTQTGRVYATSNAIFDSGSTPYLRDGDGTYDNSNYLYLLMSEDLKQPVQSANGKCFGIISWHLHGDGTKSDLHIIQPELATGTTDGSCRVLKEDGKASYTELSLGARSRLADSVNTRLARLGEASDTPAEWAGDTNAVRRATSAFLWKNKGEIGVFNSSVVFTPVTGQALAGLTDIWHGELAGTVPSASERATTGARSFTLWTTNATSGSCGSLFLATRNGSPSYVYAIDTDEKKEQGIDDNTVSQCLWGRDMDGDSNDLINYGKPTVVAFPENASKEPSQVNTAFFSGGGVGVEKGTEEETELPETCATKLADNSALAWVLCPIINMAESLIGKIDEMLSRFLFVDLGRFNTNSGLFVAWNNIRQISTVILVIIALIMIFSEAMGEGFLSNYSVKKILPRLVLAVIGIQFSWVLTREFINISNILGNGIQGLMLAPFAGIKEGLGAILPVGDLSGAAQTGYFVAIFAAIPVAFGALATVAIGVFIALVIAFVTLILRYMVIVIGVMFAPIGIAMSVLPGTQKVSKLWWESLEKAVIMYPIIMAMLAAGKIIAFGLLQPVDGQSPDGWFTLGAIIAYFAPYALLPAALKLGGTALGKLTGAFNDKSKGVFDRARSWDKGRKERRATFKKQIKQEQRIRDLNAGGLGIKRNWARNRLRASQGATGLGMYVGPHATEKRRRAEAVVAGAADKGRKQAVEEEKAKLQTEPHYSNTGALLHIAQTAPPARARAASERLIELGADGELRKLRDGVRVDAAGNNTGGPNFDQSHESRKLFDTLQQSGATAPVREKANDLVRGQAAFDTVPTAPDMQKWSKGTYEAAFLHANGDAHLDKVVERFTTDADFAATIDDAKLEKINDALASRGRALITMTDGAKKPFTPSDARLKKNITRTGNDVGAFGLPEYEYSYVWSDERYLGVMAQDVQQVCPEAVVEINGFLHVRYDMLGTELRKKGE